MHNVRNRNWVKRGQNRIKEKQTKLNKDWKLQNGKFVMVINHHNHHSYPNDFSFHDEPVYDP